MRSVFNDLIRWLIGISMAPAGIISEIIHRVKIQSFAFRQKRLRKRYKIGQDTPITHSVVDVAPGAPNLDDVAFTSGSTGTPKRISYSHARIFKTKLCFVEFYLGCCRALQIERKSLYVFHSRFAENSLTSLLLKERGLPSYVATLQAPYRIEALPTMRALAQKYGDAAVQLWIIALANPGVLYSTNPSTLCNFLDECRSRWAQVSALIREFHTNPSLFAPQLHAIRKRLESRGWRDRFATIAGCDSILSFARVCPSARLYICWDGGYVQPFLKRLARYLPPDRFCHVPMYSISTETIETAAHFSSGGVQFVPLAPGVLYEFLQEGDSAAALLLPADLQKGAVYSMLVSNRYGLRRYQTEDLFACEGFVAGIPALRFLRRQGMTYSFTGEKVTSEQITTVLERLNQHYPELNGDSYLTCMPAELPQPHYKIVVVSSSFPPISICSDEIARDADAMLRELNMEYSAKRLDGRLARMDAVVATADDFLRRIHKPPVAQSDSQFKFLPFYTMCWDARL